MSQNKAKSADINAMDQLRDEVRVQAHLAGAEAKDKFSGLTDRWELLCQSALAARSVILVTRTEVREALSLAAESIRKSAVELRSIAVRAVL